MQGSRAGFLPHIMAAAFAFCAASAHAALYGCGDLANAYGPFDYRVVPPASRNIVEAFHFTPKVEMLQGGQSGVIGGDLDYTLRAMPNHPRALLSVARLSIKQKTENPQGMHYPVECYFDRAIRFVPDDPMPHLIYAIYLKDHKRLGDVKQQLAEAERLRSDPTSYDFDYNLGLLYIDVGDYDKAAIAAQRAYSLGAPFPALMNKLKAKGKWLG